MKILELDKGQLIWIPKTVIFEGNEYPAPLDLLPVFAYRTMMEFLMERKENRDKHQ